MKYFPVDDPDNVTDFTNLRTEITGMDTTLFSIRKKVDKLTFEALAKLTDATRYHGYKKQSPSYLNYSIYENFEFLKPIPVSGNKIPSNNSYRPDYNKILSDLNICDYVDGKGVSQVWIWSYHFGNVEPDESNMSMGRLSQNHWNFRSYGDISNSYRINDMPICDKTYSLFNYNYERGLGEILENHAHHLEVILGFVDNDIFWNRFVKGHGNLDPNAVNRCGWSHSPPNVTDENQYDWDNEAVVQSDCEDWKPEGVGKVASLTCYNWYEEGCEDNGGIDFKVWWMQNMPGYQNDLIHQGKQFRNWWEFYGDFDLALIIGKRFTYSELIKPSLSSQEQNVEWNPASLPHPDYPQEDL